MSDQQSRSMWQEMRSLIAEMSDDQIRVILEAFKIYREDPSKSPEECVDIASERLGLFNSSASSKLQA